MTGLRQKMEQVESKFEECYTMMENTEGTVKELWGAAEETKALATSLIREALSASTSVAGCSLPTHKRVSEEPFLSKTVCSLPSAGVHSVSSGSRVLLV